jgi:hypothetical protein
MDNFNAHKWFKTQYLKESDDPKIGAELEAGMFGTGVAEGEGGGSKSQQLSMAINNAMIKIDDSMSYKDFAVAVGIILKEEYGTHNFGKFMEVLHAELGMEESLNEVEEMATYKVEVVLADPYEGGPDYAEDVEVKIDASLSGDELKSAVRDALYDMGYTRRSIYKTNYEKA